jgi:hypothetical protein
VNRLDCVYHISSLYHIYRRLASFRLHRQLLSMSFDTLCQFDFFPQESKCTTSPEPTKTCKVSNFIEPHNSSSASQTSSSSHSISRSSTPILSTPLVPLFDDAISLMSPLTRVSCDPFSSRSGTPFLLGLPDFASVLAQPRHWELREFLAGGKAALNGPPGVALDECAAEIYESDCQSSAESDVESDVAEVEVIKSYATSLKRSNAVRRNRRGWFNSSESAGLETSEDKKEDLTPKTASSSIYSDSEVSDLNLNDPLNVAAADADVDSVSARGIPDSNAVVILCAWTVVSATPETKTTDDESSDHASKDTASPRRHTCSSWLGAGIADFLALERSVSSDFLSSRSPEVRVGNAASRAYDSASPPSTSMRVPRRELSCSHGAKSSWRDVIERRNAGEWGRKILRGQARASTQKEEKKIVVSQAAAQSPVGSNTNSRSGGLENDESDVSWLRHSDTEITVAIPTEKTSLPEGIEELEFVMTRGRKPHTRQVGHLFPRTTSLEDLPKTVRRSSSSRFVEGFGNEERIDKKSIMNLLGNAKEEEKRGVTRNIMSRTKLRLWKVLKSTREKIEARRKDVI